MSQNKTTQIWSWATLNSSCFHSNSLLL